MGSETPRKVPVIDLSNLELKPGTLEWDSAKVEVRQALEEYGCFEAIFTKIPLDLRKAIFGAMEEIFDLPLQIKSRNVSKNAYRGYMGNNPFLSLYESLGMDGSNKYENIDSLTNIMWPEGNPSFSKTMHSFSLHVIELEKMIRRLVLESLGVAKYLEEQMESTNYLLRVMKYKAPETTDRKVGLEGHSDLNIMTILNQNQVDGLEVQTKDGEWINVNPSGDKFLVLVGDAFHAWTNGRVRSAPHRVMMTGTKPRYSTGLFSTPTAGYIVKTPQELVDDEHPLLYKHFDYDEYIRFYYANIDQKKDEFLLKTYCGV